MTRIKLIDVDSKIPNLALMQVSSYHKAKGDIVGFNIDDPDSVFISCIFKRNGANARGISKFYPNAKVYLGGSGINYNWLPKEMQKIYPDYNLYNMDFSIGFTTRGCIRKCPFCIVPVKEGEIQRWQYIKEFYNPEFTKIMLLDNNIFADREWFFKNTDFIIENDLQVDIAQGLDIKLLDREYAERLRDLKWCTTMKFAFDNMSDEKAVREGIQLLKDVGIDIRHQIQFYVLVGFNTTPEQDKYRCRLLKELGTNAFVMPYIKNDWTSRIARWANRKWLYWCCDIDEYGQAIA